MPLSKENQDKIIGALRRADDAQLAQIITYAVELRKLERKRINRERLDEVRVGMRVMVAEAVRPKYLARQLGTIEEIKNTKILVKLDRGPQGKFRTGRVYMPASALVILQSQPEGV